jgi:tetratricopeptide (TPR) repeat protein
MRFRTGMMFALMAGLALGGCAAGAVGAGGPLVSPTGKVYEPGIRPTQTRYSQSGTLFLAQGLYEQALEQAREGIESNPENPIHYFLAGEAAVGLGEFELADSVWVEAERLFPAYELEIEPAREAAWAEAFNVGVQAYNAGDAAGAIEAWTQADLIYSLRPEAAQNLAVLLTQEAQYDEAIRVYRRGIGALDELPATRVLEAEEVADRAEARDFMQDNLAQLLLYTDQFGAAEALLRELLRERPDDVEVQANLAAALSRQGREDEATQIYTRLLTAPDLTSEQLFNIGVSLFNAADYARAAQAFGRVTQTNPNSRDAWYNQANALYAAESWRELVPVAERLVEVDPLNENAALILARAHRELEENQRALAALQRIQLVPIFVEELQLRPSAQTTTVRGRVMGNEAAAGTPVRLRFTFYSNGRTLGSETVTVTAPAREQSANFELVFDQQATAYSYELAP